jgi:hypothetical protein
MSLIYLVFTDETDEVKKLDADTRWSKTRHYCGTDLVAARTAFIANNLWDTREEVIGKRCRQTHIVSYRGQPKDIAEKTWCDVLGYTPEDPPETPEEKASAERAEQAELQHAQQRARVRDAARPPASRG